MQLPNPIRLKLTQLIFSLPGPPHTQSGIEILHKAGVKLGIAMKGTCLNISPLRHILPKFHRRCSTFQALD